MQVLPDRMQNRPMDKLSDQKDLVRAFTQAIYESREASKSEIAETDRNWQYYFGQHYLRNVGGQWMPDKSGGDKMRIQRDIIQLAVDALRPILVKMRPHILCLATYPNEDANLELSGNRSHPIQGLKNSDVAAFLTEALLREHRRRHEDILLSELILEVMITGQAYRVILPVERPGFGTALEPKLYPRARVFLDPNGTRLADFKDFKYVAFEDDMDANEIYQNYGVRERDYTQKSDQESSRVDREGGLFQGVTRFRRYGRQVKEEFNYERRIYKVHTGYFNEAASELVAYHETPQKLKYPFGRQLVMINEQLIVVDQPNPFWHGDYPVTCYQSLPVPHIARALSECGKLIDVQKGLNILMNALIGNSLLGNNPKLLYEEGSFNPIDLQTGPGGTVRVSQDALRNNRIEWLKPPPTDRGAYNLLKDMENYGKEDVAGVTAALQGQELSAGSSGVYANSLQSASMTGPTFRIQQLDAGHHRNARQEIECLQQFVDWREVYYQELHDMHQYHPMMSDAIRDLYYRVEYESQAELPHNPIARHNLYFNMYVEGIIDLEEYVQKAHISMRPELREKLRQGSLENFMPGVPRDFRLQLMAQKAQAEAQAGALGSQMGGGGQPGGGGGNETLIAGKDAENRRAEGGIAGDPNQRAL